jgi:DNA-directed RNA polymerase subunit RPC12/RpoP
MKLTVTIVVLKDMENKMGEYECVNCNKIFWADEPSEEMDLCDECIAEIDEGEQ